MFSTILSTYSSKGALLAIHVCCLASHTATLPGQLKVFKIKLLSLHLGVFNRLFSSLDLDDELFHLCIHGGVYVTRLGLASTYKGFGHIFI